MRPPPFLIDDITKDTESTTKRCIFKLSTSHIKRSILMQIDTE
jgi:hypothetical protein